MSSSGIMTQASSINHCYASIKLWLLLERRLSNTSEAESQKYINTGTFTIWNELWSPFLLLLVELSTHQTGMQAVKHFASSVEDT